MPATYLSPISNDQVVDSNGAPLVGGYWNVFLAGTSTPVTTYIDNTGVTPQPTNITLDAAGRPANPIWLSGGIPVKFRLFSAAAVPLLTVDNVSGINDPAGVSAQDQWVLYGAPPTYISATSFSVAGDQTGTFQIGRRVKTTNTGGVRYSSITNSVYGAVTTVTVTNDSGTLDSGLSDVSYGLLSATSTSVPTTIARAGAVTTSGLTQATARILGRTTVGTGAVEELTGANVSALLSAASDTAQGAVELATTAEVQAGTDTARAVTPAGMQAGKLVVMTMQAATGTAVNFTGIPSWVKRITVSFSGVSIDGANNIVVQIGDSGGLENSGYLGAAGVIQNAGASTVGNFTSGFGIIGGAAANILHGQMVLTLMDAATNLWSASHGIGWSNTTVSGHGGGAKALSATLDRISILPTVGNFDAGNIGVAYE